jgi:catechol 2,3-dioxygenase-like lactoylglutathione lyase family enzyme
MNNPDSLALIRNAIVDIENGRQAKPASTVKTPRLAHVVLNVPEIKPALDFYTGFLGYTVVAEDKQLGVYFLSAGDDHHTIALGECLPRGPRALLRLPRMLPRLVNLLRARFSDERSASGQRRVRPTLGAIRMALRPGLQHIGMRVESEDELRKLYSAMKTRGIKVQWAVNHGDMIKGLYLDDGNGNMVELFVDGARGRDVLDLARRAGGFHNFKRITDRVGAPQELPSYDLDPETELGAR